MSRRSRHGHHAHSHASGRPAHHAAPAPERPPTPADGAAPKHPEPGVAAVITDRAVAAPPAPVAAPDVALAITTPAAPERAAAATAPEPSVIQADARPVMDADQTAYRTTCTSPQLRRFIKSRPWVPLHELRRRFGISGDDDDVTPIRVAGQLLFVGLPPAEARMVGELLSGGDVGYELSLDPTAPIVVGVYPMRPVPRS